jgi:hypothetical protein
MNEATKTLIKITKPLKAIMVSNPIDSDASADNPALSADVIANPRQNTHRYHAKTKFTLSLSNKFDAELLTTVLETKSVMPKANPTKSKHGNTDVG